MTKLFQHLTKDAKATSTREGLNTSNASVLQGLAIRPINKTESVADKLGVSCNAGVFVIHLFFVENGLSLTNAG